MATSLVPTSLFPKMQFDQNFEKAILFEIVQRPNNYAFTVEKFHNNPRVKGCKLCKLAIAKTFKFLRNGWSYKEEEANSNGNRRLQFPFKKKFLNRLLRQLLDHFKAKAKF